MTAAALARTYKGARVLVTGHTGFKGAWLTLWLHELGARVWGFALPPETKPSLFEAADVVGLCEHEIGDVRDRERVAALVRTVKPEIVFHLAGQSIVGRGIEEPADTIATNVMGTTFVLDAVRGAGISTNVVIVTSDKCYAHREDVYGYREDDALGGDDPYAASKAAAELISAAYRATYFAPDRHASHGVGVATARAGNVFGGGDWAEGRLVPDVMRALAANEAVQLREPEAVRPWQHVLDALHGYLMLGARLKEAPAQHSSAYNIGPDAMRACTVRELVAQLLVAWGEGRAREPTTPAASPRRVALAVGKAQAQLGYVTQWDIATSLAATADWYRHHQRGASPSQMRAISLGQIRAFAGTE